MRAVSVLPAVALLLGLAVPASAVPITGVLNIAGSVAVGITTLDWRPPTDLGYGDATTTTPALGYFGGPPLGPTGSVPGGVFPGAPTGLRSKDLTLASDAGYSHVDIGPGGTFVGSFLNTFLAPGYGGLFFDLTQVESPAGAPCNGTETTAGTTCSVTAFTVTVLPGNAVSIAMSVLGFFQDSTIADSRAFYAGRYTTQVGLTTQQIEDILTKNQQDPGCAPGDTGVICGSYSANFNARAVPEPATMLTLGAGAALMAYRRRRAAKKA